MKKINLENLNEHLKQTSLTSEEKLDMFQNIRAYSNNNPVRNQSFLFKHSLAYASVLAIIAGASATSIAAEGSLPGDILYPIKTEVNETVLRSVSFTDKQKAKTSVTLVTKRMEELEEMVSKKEDTSEKVDIVITKLEEHIEELKIFLEDNNKEDLETKEDRKKIVEIYTTLEKIMDEHIDSINKIEEAKKVEKEITKDIVNSKPEPLEEVIPDKSDPVVIELETVTQLNIEENNLILEGETVTKVKDFSSRLDILIEEAK